MKYANYFLFYYIGLLLFYDLVSFLMFYFPYAITKLLHKKYVESVLNLVTFITRNTIALYNFRLIILQN